MDRPQPPSMYCPLRYGVIQSVEHTDQNDDPNNIAVTICHYAHMHRSTGLAELDANNFRHPHVVWYGPYLHPPAAAAAYDASLICHCHTHHVGNYRGLVRCVLASVERAAIPSLDTPTKILFASFVIDNLAAHVCNPDFPDAEWIIRAFGYTCRERRRDFDALEAPYDTALRQLGEEAFKAYVDDTWPREVWTEFLADLGVAPPAPTLLPAAVRVLVGGKPIKDFVDLALPDVAILDFDTAFAARVCGHVESHLGCVLGPGVFADLLFLAKMMVFVLGRHFPDLNPSHRPTLLGRYAGHVADAIIATMVRTSTVSEIVEMPAAKPTLHPPESFLDGVRGTTREAALAAVVAEIAAGYNKRQWPAEVWQPLLNFLQETYMVGMDPGVFVTIYSQFDGASRNPVALAPMPAPREEKVEFIEGDVAYEVASDSSGDGVGAVEEAVPPGCFAKPADCACCMGPSVVSYRFRWQCKAEHMDGGEAEETYGPYRILNGDCAGRIHEEVKQFFPFVTAFRCIQTDPYLVPPPYVSQACTNNGEGVGGYRSNVCPNNDPGIYQEET